MHLVMLGPPGAGKGTQAALLARARNIPHISTGDMLREAVREGRELGRAAAEYMQRGDLVPDEVVIGITRDRLGAPDTRRGFVLDGFPRTAGQAESLTEILRDTDRALQRVLNLEVPESELIRRLTGRRVCPNCGETYHLVFSPPRALGTCDRCGNDLVQREDDKESTVRQRLEVYHRQSEPLIRYYLASDILVTVEGTGTVEEVHERVLNAIT
ncbi:MAG: adenylate kinase [Bacillota bacterium]